MRTFKKNRSVILYEELENILTKTPSKSESNDQNDEIYDLLNHDLLGKDFLNKVGRNLIKSEARIGSEEVKGAFVPTIYETDTFPQELVVMLEKVLYDSCNEEIIPAEESFFFDQTANAMGAKKFMLDVESLYFHFPQIAEDRKQERICFDRGGSIYDKRIKDFIAEKYTGTADCRLLQYRRFNENVIEIGA